jgi:hypothetical protein
MNWRSEMSERILWRQKWLVPAVGEVRDPTPVDKSVIAVFAF